MENSMQLWQMQSTTHKYNASKVFEHFCTNRFLKQFTAEREQTLPAPSFESQQYAFF